jgi:hypothetical protein
MEDREEEDPDRLGRHVEKLRSSIELERRL